jgi:hypothetical protein
MKGLLTVCCAVLFFQTVYSQKTDIETNELKGKVKKISNSTIYLDSIRINENKIPKKIEYYSADGFIEKEESYLNEIYLGKNISVIVKKNGKNTRTEKKFYDNLDSHYFTRYYSADREGFDTLISDYRKDSTYYIKFVNTKNQMGLKNSILEINGKNGNINYYTEIEYNDKYKIAEIRYFDQFKKLELKNKYIYNEKNELYQIVSENGFYYEYVTTKYDQQGNWTESITFKTKGGKLIPVLKEVRVIEYY